MSLLRLPAPSPIFLAAVAAVLAVTGCKNGDKPAGQTKGNTGTTGDAPAGTIEVTATGTEPRLALGGPPPSSDSYALLSIDHGLESAPEATKTKIRLVLRWQPGASGQSKYAVDSAAMPVDAPNMSAGERKIVEAIPRGFESVRGTVRVSDGVLTVSQTGGIPTRPSVPWLVEAVTIPVPVESLGVGGTWTMSQAVSRQGQAGRRVRHYKVLSIDQRVVRVQFSGTERLQPEKPVDSRASGMQVTAHEQKVEGTLQFSAGHVLASSGEVTIRASSKMRTRFEGRPAREDSLDTLTRITLAPARAGQRAGKK